MKTFLFVSRRGRSLSLAMKVSNEENRVLFHCTDSGYSNIGEGLVEKPKESSINDLLSIRPDCVVFDEPNDGYNLIASAFREKQIPVFGADLFTESLSLNKTYNNKVMRAHGINVPRSFIFDSDSMQYSNIIVETIFSKGEPISVLYTFDFIYLMNDDIGPSTSSMGSVTIVGSTNDRLYKESLGKFERTLKEKSYSGHLSIKLIVTKNALFGYELIPFINYSSVFNFCELNRGKLSDILLLLSNGNLRTIKLKDNWTCTVRLITQPYPSDCSINFPKETVINGLNELNMKHVWFEDVMKDSNYICACTSGNLLSISSRGDTLREARRRTYRTVERLSIDDVMYRTDIGLKVQNEYDLLRQYCWLK
jgi:phosphoribosylamine-glycine ligase